MTAWVLVFVAFLVVAMLWFLLVISWKDGGPLAKLLTTLVALFAVATFPYKAFVDLVVSLF